MNAVILSIDEGTTNAKAICVDRSGQILSKGSKGLSVSHPKPAWSEQDPLAILEGVNFAIQTALADKSVTIEAIGISNQRESVLIWERSSGKPLTPVIVWQCRRSEAFCEALAQSEFAEIVQHKTGLPIDPLFPAAKIRWALDHLQDGHARAASGELCIGTIDSWLLWNLTDGEAFVTDVSNASRTQLFNIHTQRWDEELAEIFGIPLQCLAEIKPSCAYRGQTKNVAGLPDGVAILSQIGDSHAALYGQGGFMPGVIKATYGTGSSLMTPISRLSPGDYRLAHTTAWNDGELTYALEGNITHTGAGVDYMARLLGMKDVQILADLAQTTDSNYGVYFVPALSGLGAPYWQSRARGLITGLTENAGAAQLARAALEAIAYQVADVFYLMEEMAGTALDQLLVDGGPTKNPWLMQFQSNVINRPVARINVAEVSALGAGYLAGKALGWWNDRGALATLDRNTHLIRPNQQAERDRECYQAWKQVIRQTLA